MLKWFKNGEKQSVETIGTPDDVAHLCVFLGSDLSDYITGQVICGWRYVNLSGKARMNNMQHDTLFLFSLCFVYDCLLFVWLPINTFYPIAVDIW